jgi:predicted metalloprotease with PDZ domain
MSKHGVHYELTVTQPKAHLFTTVCRIEHAAALQEVWLPNWIPGSYKIRDFSKHLITLTARADNQPVPLTQLSKNRWRVESPAARVEITATIYAWDISVRGCHLDQTHGFFNGTHCFLAVEGQENNPCSVSFHPPEGKEYHDWKLATAMTESNTHRNGFGSYQAENYDELIDHPIEMGTFEEIEFKAKGVLHRMVITGPCKLDRKRLAHDLQKICETQISLFGEFPSSHYVFLTRVIGKGFNGLEHRASSSLVIGRKNMPYPGMPEDSEDYATFLSLVSHEYFHTWNIKRIKPEVFMPYHLDKESYTRQLWIFEGFTSYFEDLLLVRSGVISVERFLSLFAEKMESVLNAPGHRVQSVTDSSFCAWDKFYDPNENTPNSGVSYYTKGALIAFMIDAYLREHTSYTLDDVMRTLWNEFGKVYKGVPEHWLEQYLAEITNHKISPMLHSCLYEAGDLPIKTWAKALGLSFTYEVKSSETSVELGIKCESDNQTITCCLTDGAAERAGLSAQDKLIAINGLSAFADKHDILLRPYQPGDIVKIHAFRRDELMTFDLTLQAKRPREVKLGLADCEGVVLERRNGWLRQGG